MPYKSEHYKKRAFFAVCTDRRGALQHVTTGLEKATQNRGNRYQKVADSEARSLPKAEALAEAGIDKRRAFR